MDYYRVNLDTLLFGSSAFNRFCRKHKVDKRQLSSCHILSYNSYSEMYVQMGAKDVIKAEFKNGKWEISEGNYFELVEEVG